MSFQSRNSVTNQTSYTRPRANVGETIFAEYQDGP